MQVFQPITHPSKTFAKLIAAVLCVFLALPCLRCQDITSKRFFKLNFNTFSAPNSIFTSIPNTIAPPDYEPSHLIEAELRFPIKLKGQTKLIGQVGYNRELLSGFYVSDGDDVDLMPLHESSFSVAAFHSFKNGLSLKAILSINHQSNQFMRWSRRSFGFRNTVLLEKEKNNKSIGLGISAGRSNGRLSILPLLLYKKELPRNWELDLLLPAKMLLVKNIKSDARLLFGARGSNGNYFFDNQIADAYEDLSYRRLNVNAIIGYERQLTPVIGIGIEGGATIPIRSGLYRLDQQWTEVHNFGKSVAPYLNVKFFLALPN